MKGYYIAGGFTLAASIFLLFAWFLVYGGNEYGQCESLAYSIAPGTYCPWPDQCVPNHCVIIRAQWYPFDKSPSHQADVEPAAWPGCWTTDSYDQIMQYLNKNYPVSSKFTCYVYTWRESTKTDVKVADPNAPLASQLMFYLSLAIASLAIVVLIIVGTIDIVRCCRDTDEHVPLIN